MLLKQQTNATENITRLPRRLSSNNYALEMYMFICLQNTQMLHGKFDVENQRMCVHQLEHP